MKDNKIYLAHILECIEKIESYTVAGEDKFFTSMMMQDAVIRNLEIIGEAAKRVSGELKTQFPGIPWSEMSGMRDVLIHDYMGVDLKIVWSVVVNELPRVRNSLIKILN